MNKLVRPLLFCAILVSACDSPRGTHLVDGTPLVAACDNYSGGDHCHEYTGDEYTLRSAADDCAQNGGDFTTTQVCGPEGRGGRCTFLVGLGIESVQSCYLEEDVCRRACEMSSANRFAPN